MSSSSERYGKSPEAVESHQRRDVLTILREETREEMLRLLPYARLEYPSMQDNEEFSKRWKHHVKNGQFRDRFGDELQKMWKGYKVLRASIKSLGGVSIIHHGDSTEISTVWVKHEKLGIGTKIVEKAVESELANRARLIALAKEARGMFLNNGFVLRGKVPDVQMANDAPAFIQAMQESDSDVYELDLSLVQRDEHNADDHKQNGEK